MESFFLKKLQNLSFYSHYFNNISITLVFHFPSLISSLVLLLFCFPLFLSFFLLFLSHFPPLISPFSFFSFTSHFASLFFFRSFSFFFPSFLLFSPPFPVPSFTLPYDGSSYLAALCIFPPLIVRDNQAQHLILLAFLKFSIIQNTLLITQVEKEIAEFRDNDGWLQQCQVIQRIAVIEKLNM